MLDKYKISRTFFVKTDQDDCAYLDVTASKPQEATVEEAQKNSGLVRSAVVPDSPALVAEELAKKDKEGPAKLPSGENLVKLPVKTVPEHILVVADAVKENAQLDDGTKTLAKKEASEPADEKAPEKKVVIKVAEETTA